MRLRAFAGPGSDRVPLTAVFDDLRVVSHAGDGAVERPSLCDDPRQLTPGGAAELCLEPDGPVLRRVDGTQVRLPVEPLTAWRDVDDAATLVVGEGDRGQFLPRRVVVRDVVTGETVRSRAFREVSLVRLSADGSTAVFLGSPPEAPDAADKVVAVLDTGTGRGGGAERRPAGAAGRGGVRGRLRGRLRAGRRRS